jgi:oxygen-dependent protoporphyrinogen oxidase
MGPVTGSQASRSLPVADATPHVVVIGAGIAGLAAAHTLATPSGEGTATPLRITVLDGAAQVGGKLRVSEVAGIPVDAGAEQFVVRRPEARELVAALGLDCDVIHPGAGGASVWSRGRLHPLPPRTVMGVPGDVGALAASRLLTRTELLRLRSEPLLPRSPLDADVSVGEYVARRAGRAVVDRLVEPLLGGVWAGRADELSLAATMPQLWAAARNGDSLVRTAATLGEAAAASAGPVFASLRGGLGRLPGALLARLQTAPEVTVRTSTTVRELARTPHGWRLTVGSAHAPETIDADAVILGVPSHPASRLLADVCPGAAAELGAIDYASVALITLALRRADVGALPPGTGFLVPPVEGRLVKAATFASAKWSWYADAAPDIAIVRLSVGRHGDTAALQRDDGELVTAARLDLATLTGVAAEPLEARVTRWGGALPQYAVGHPDRVARIRDAVATLPGLALAGAAYEGVGVPACKASGRAAADEVRRHLGAIRARTASGAE